MSGQAGESYEEFLARHQGGQGGAAGGPAGGISYEQAAAQMNLDPSNIIGYEEVAYRGGLDGTRISPQQMPAPVYDAYRQGGYNTQGLVPGQGLPHGYAYQGGPQAQMLADTRHATLRTATHHAVKKPQRNCFCC